MARKIIIDTDPGCDDILALLQCLAASPEDIEVLLISVTYGNVEVQSCLRNVLSMFHVIEKEMAWRKTQGLPEGFDLLKKTKPIIAAGATSPLTQRTLAADFYHGVDGLGNVHETHPHHSYPSTEWRHLFESSGPEDPLIASAKLVTETAPSSPPTLFSTTRQYSPDVILSILAANPEDSISLIAIGPLTNYSVAASKDIDTFLRAKELLVMGGAIDVPGNMTPVAEFNCIADPVAAATLYALTSPYPPGTMPPKSQLSWDRPPNFPPSHLSRPLSLILFPLDVTTPHFVTRHELETAVESLCDAGSPLAEWVSAFMEATFQKTESLYESTGNNADNSHSSLDQADSITGNQPSTRRGDTAMCLHDIVTTWYAIHAPTQSHQPDSSSNQSAPSQLHLPESDVSKASSSEIQKQGWQISAPIDIRVETTGQWTRGMHVRDGRGMKLHALKDEVRDAFEQDRQLLSKQYSTSTSSFPPDTSKLPTAPSSAPVHLREAANGASSTTEIEIKGDSGNWLQRDMGNRIRMCVSTPGHNVLGRELLRSVFGV